VSTKLLLGLRSRPHLRPVAVIIALVLVANGAYLLGLSNYDPAGWTSGFASLTCHVACGFPAIDPNAGWLTTDLGHQAALSLLHGHWPWWNPYEGLGMPLLGEMQAGALSPLVLLFALPGGLLWLHIAFELIAGIATYLWLRKLGVPALVATTGGVLFALNGTFAWVGNAVLNPIPFMPLALLGIETIYDRAHSRRPGWWLLAVSLALSLYAGFPEVATLDGLLLAGYALVRLGALESTRRLFAARQLILAGVVGSLLALPALVPFYDFLKVSFVGIHDTSFSTLGALAPHTASMFVAPYTYGPIFAVPSVSKEWGFVGGYFGVTVLALALYGMIGRHLRALRWYLAGYATLGLLAAFGVGHVRLLWNLVPTVSHAMFDRYIIPSCELAIITLAMLGLSDLVLRLQRRRLVIATVVTLLATTAAVVTSTAVTRGAPLDALSHAVLVAGRIAPFAALALLLVISLLAKVRAPLLVASLVVLESLVYFVVPSVMAPATVTVDSAPIAFLRAHLGHERFVSLGPIAPNWGTYYHLSELTMIDLPFPKNFANLVRTQLAQGESQPVNQYTVENGVTGIELYERAIAAHLTTYEQASAKYLVANSSLPLLTALTSEGVHKVFDDHTVAIYELPNPHPFFSTTPGCTLTTTSLTTVKVDCTKPATLTRSELFMDGWYASVNGRSVLVRSSGVYEALSLPAGVSTVTFTYRPPHERLAGVGALLGLLVMLGSALLHRRVWRGSPISDSTDQEPTA